MMREHTRQDLRVADLLEWLTMDNETFKKRFRDTPMLRTKRSGLLRNCCVALGNVGDRSALSALERVRSDPDPIIAEHAVWALNQIELKYPSIEHTTNAIMG
jgi:epoxyqueuosine reductase